MVYAHRLMFKCKMATIIAVLRLLLCNVEEYCNRRELFETARKLLQDVRVIKREYFFFFSLFFLCFYVTVTSHFPTTRVSDP